MTKRIIWIDIAKAIAILLMVIGHTSIPHVLSNFIWAFHMPLFFIASGFTNGGGKTLAEFIMSKTKSLLLPFVVYSAIVVPIMTSNGWLTFTDWASHGWGAYALWFIPVLFLSQICAKVIIGIRNKLSRLVVLAVFLFIGVCLSYDRCYLPWTLASVPYATFLLIIGTCVKRIPQNVMRPDWWKIIALFFATAIISHYWRLDMCYNSILPIIPLTLGAVSGTLMVFMFSMRIEKHMHRITGVLVAVGKETYIVVAFSQITIMLLNEYFHLNVLVKYCLLVTVLISLKYAKDGVNKLFKTKVL